jgi:hypothetical protein
MKLTVVFVFLILFASCTVALVQTKSSNTKILDGFYGFENDTISLKYDFWLERGVMRFTIVNKLKSPIFLDWKKSSFLFGDTKLDYWQDIEIRKSSGLYGMYSVNNIGYFGSTTITKPERITFIPPDTKIDIAVFLISPKGFIPGGQAAKSGKPNTFKFDQTNSPIKFGNFLTYSTVESFDREYYIKNDFYVSQVDVMKRSKFHGSTPSEFPLADPKFFYININ